MYETGVALQYNAEYFVYQKKTLTETNTNSNAVQAMRSYILAFSFVLHDSGDYICSCV